MKVAVVYNRESKNVINLFGVPNREKYGRAAIKRISDALKKGGHQVATFEGDKHLIPNLEDFMPRVLKGERPGLVFNISYGIQGQARYTHVPSILEMVGIPYVGSGPLAHSLALDKVVAKMIFRQNNLPTPDFAVLENPGFEMPEIAFPLIIKPKNEAVSYGLRIVHNEEELREGAQNIFNKYDQPVLAEQYIEGREINVGLLGNNPTETLPPVELIFEGSGPPIYTYEDKVHRSGRTVTASCPADIPPEMAKNAQELAQKAFASLGCFDFARVDMRADAEGNLYILEINSLASLGLGGSYVAAAKHIGLDYEKLVNRMVQVASARYFGMPNPPKMEVKKLKDKKTIAFGFLTERRDYIERRLNQWCHISSNTSDPVGIRLAVKSLSQFMESIKMQPVKSYSDDRFNWFWSTRKGFKDGILFIGHIDTPVLSENTHYVHRQEPEYLFGEGIGSSRAPLVMLEFTLRALRSQRLLHKMPLGVLYYSDEGQDAMYSEKVVREASSQAAKVIVLRPGSPDTNAVIQRRGLSTYRLEVEGKSLRLGQAKTTAQPLLWLTQKLNAITALSNRSHKIAVSATDIKVTAFPKRLPHRVQVHLTINYYDTKVLGKILEDVKKILGPFAYGIKWHLEAISNRPPMKKRRVNQKFINDIRAVAEEWEIPFNTTSALWPSVAGLVPSRTPVICGMGPVAEQLYTPQECIQRISLVQRALLLTQYLIKLSRGAQDDAT